MEGADIELEKESNEVDENQIEIGDDAVWTLSTAKPGNGIHQLRDNDLTTYWQSDGTQPHLINIQFAHKRLVQYVNLYLKASLDESYTPKKISIRSGTTVHDLKEIHTQSIIEPDGWISIPLYSDPSLTLHPEYDEKKPLRTFFLQIAILSMHQNGRDTHIRQIRIYSPRDMPKSILYKNAIEPTTESFIMHSGLR